MHRLIIAFAILTSACQADETVTAYLTGPAVFNLVSIDGAPFGAEATIDLSEAGRIQGQAPCNQYFADQKRSIRGLKPAQLAQHAWHVTSSMRKPHFSLHCPK